MPGVPPPASSPPPPSSSPQSVAAAGDLDCTPKKSSARGGTGAEGAGAEGAGAEGAGAEGGLPGSRATGLTASLGPLFEPADIEELRPEFLAANVLVSQLRRQAEKADALKAGRDEALAERDRALARYDSLLVQLRNR